MSLSDRTSDRLVESGTSDLARADRTTDKGADGGDVPISFQVRIGSRQLGALAAKLSDRDRAVLHSLEALHFLTSRQVERLHFHASSTTALAAARSSRRVLARLYDLRLIDRLERRIGGLHAGSAGYIFSLGPLGARLLGQTTRRRSREPSLAHLEHVLAVSEMVVQLHEQERSGQVELLAVEPEPTCWRALVAVHGGRLWLKPDLRLTLGKGDQELHWFVEIDRATEHRPILERKCRTYLQAWRDGGEQRRAGVFPRVLWVVPDDRRRRDLDGLLAAMPDLPAGMFAVTTDAEALAVLYGGRS